MPKITKRLVETVKPEQRDVFIWDTEVRGFGVRIKPSGLRSYLVQYRNQHGRSRRLTIGQHGRLTADQARRRAKSLLGEVETGKDPVADVGERKRDTFGAVADEFINRHVKHKDLRSAKEIERLLKVEVTPRWRNRPIDSISRRDVIELLDGIIDRGAPYTANRTLAVIRSVVNATEFKRLAAKKSSSGGPTFNPRRWYCGKNELIQANGKTYAFSNQWGGQKWHMAMGLLKDRYSQFGVDFTPT